MVLAKDEVQHLHQQTAEKPSYELTVDLESQTVSDAEGFEAKFEIDSFRKKCFLEGLDHIALTLQHEDKISEYEASL